MTVHYSRPSIFDLLSLTRCALSALCGKKSRLLVTLAAVLAVAQGSSTRASQPQEAPDHPRAENIAVRWRVDTNYLDGNRFRSTLTLSNEGRAPLDSTDWALYFNLARTIAPESLPRGLRIERINGQLWRLTPTAAFAPVPPGEERAVTFEAGAWAIKESDAPAGFYVVFEGESPAPLGSETVAPFTEERQTDRSRSDTVPVPTPRRRYRANDAALSRLPAEQVGRITPAPVSIEEQPGAFALDDVLAVRFANADVKQEAAYLAGVLKPLLGARPAVERGDDAEGAIVLDRDDARVPGAGDSDPAYVLEVTGSGIRITGASRKAVFYGIQSLRALLSPEHEETTISAVTVRDAPRFGYRGMHLDVARNFQSKSAVKKLLDLMARYKLNTFHFHLTDDEGWRLPIEELPALTEVGGRRGHPSGDAPREHLLPSFGSGPSPDTAASHGSGFYSRSDFKEILRYARERHITVVPEIDVPGHARAAIVAMEARHDRLAALGKTEAARRYRLQDPADSSTYRSVQGWANNVVNACRPSTYRFMATVIDDVREMYEEAGGPLHAVHVGGDEVPGGAWEDSPMCQRLIQENDSLDSADQLQRYFFKRVYKMLDERDLAMAGWQEVAFAEQRANDSTVINAPDPYFARRGVRPYVWYGGRENAYKLASAGYEVVMAHASRLYFDMAYSKHPQEAGLYWTGFTDTRDAFGFAPPGARTDDEKRFLPEEGRANVLGVQGQLWGETLKGSARMEYMAAPRLLVLAERAWSAQPEWATVEGERKRLLRADWNEFANRLGQRALPHLDRAGFAYRLPPPGAVVENGLLRANVAYPGLTIRYATDGEAPTAQSPRYTEPVHVGNDSVKLRTFSTTGRASRTVTVRAGGR
ncbi:MAG: beta-N-acetylhexosaminidase [Bacteroidetes bacterium QS_8_64_10]|nr:MAG: beta-N-acetylhexosaminidase [Bacteroidetes bacterium QS_8_64_10]